MRIAYKNLEEIVEGKRLLGRRRHRRKIDICIKTYGRKGYKDMDWILLAWIGSGEWTL
jgi:hypothetical protein